MHWSRDPFQVHPGQVGNSITHSIRQCTLKDNIQYNINNTAIINKNSETENN